MIITYQPDYVSGYWTAYGMGPLRHIAVEAATRKTACKEWIRQASRQLEEMAESEFKPFTSECYTHVADENYYPLPRCEY